MSKGGEFGKIIYSFGIWVRLGSVVENKMFCGVAGARGSVCVVCVESLKD